MQIHYTIPNTENSILTIGSFDGVHIGHQYLISSIIKLGNKRNLENYIITFDPHPRLVVHSSSDFKILTTVEEKIEKFKALGVSNLVILPFDKRLSQLSAEDFIQNYILNPFHPEVVVLGYDHRFGKDRKGSQETFEELRNRENLNFDILKIEEYQHGNQHISSTVIRNFLKEGKIKEANNLLGSEYTMSGKVMRGKQLGRTIGFPTANLAINTFKIIPKNGVYATIVEIHGKRYRSATNIGTNPTTDLDLNCKIETYILDFDRDIYDQEITIYFQEYLRSEMKYDSLEDLCAAIQNDVEMVYRLINLG